MGITPLIMSMQGINATHRGANLMFGAMDGQMALANGVTGNESPRDVASLAQMDKAMAMQGAYARSIYFAGLAMQESAQRMQQEDLKLKRRLMDAGAIFV